MPKSSKDTPKFVYTFDLGNRKYACDVLGLLSAPTPNDNDAPAFCADFITAIMVEQELFQIKSDLTVSLQLLKAEKDMYYRNMWDINHAGIKMTETGVAGDVSQDKKVKETAESLKNAEYQHRLISTIKQLATEKYNSLFTNKTTTTK